MTLQNSKRKLPDKRWNRAVLSFLKWLNEYYPDCTHWHLLTRQIVKEYLSCYEGNSSTHKRLQLQPIQQTSRFMDNEYGLPDFASNLRIGSKLGATPKKVYLADVVSFCDFLKKNNPRLEAGVALQGLAGLQLQEATRLTWDKVDLAQGLIEISGEVKNEYRNRVIPVCSRVIDALIRAHKRKRENKAKVIEINETVIVNRSGYGYNNNWDSYSREVKAEMKKWNPKIDWAVKDLRNCLMTFASIYGLTNDLWEQYVGHVPKTVTARHYVPRLTSVSFGEIQELERQMNFFRFQVIEPLEKGICGEFDKKILNFFEHGVVL